MTDLFDAEEGQTLLTPEERKGLKPTYITYRSELNEAEQANILKAERWLFGGRRKLAPQDLADQGFICDMHKRMYGDVWNWAGTFRKSDRNIGVDFYQIHPAMRSFLDDIRYWIEHSTYVPDELAVRFHHRLVFIHPFPNGNGRLSRLMADCLAMSLGQPRFTWGRTQLVRASELRTSYIQALRKADGHDLTTLLAFARS
ncbi:mobile mystery protein B [Dyella flava]|uniref:Mobile mystery protein B n=1 Tax=Dyella flava TaxID=1920170 RepID=A0ABS2K0Z6_9GAMM|nr:mobile mystery protein B [Dyella flava]MBM7124916.1 mobile mystery protein B [Dyella flava]GLQ49869.1 cell filamentation protein [Dyella flava]